jgi:D-alanyl-lipoteichoic acid acyltransferase DltB (MBOAT superfamily)
VLFNSKVFAALLAVVLAVYYSLSDHHKRVFLLVVSVVFYGFWDPSLLLQLTLCTGVNWWCAGQISRSESPILRKRLLFLAMAVSFGMLGFYKYYDFFVGEFIAAAGLVGLDLSGDALFLRLALPVGISFYTFQTASYTIDVYRKDCAHDPVFWRFFLYVTFFPQLVAGPVERAPHLLPQFQRPFRLSREDVRRGVFLILLGFVKKVVIADRLARAIAPNYSAEAAERISSAKAMVSQLLFTTQIYVDFSSYSDIAIGLGLLLGYSIRPNFNLPFVVPSIPERWRRWHLSMSEWFRDYIFIPLGGSRLGEARTQINILIVMLLSGLWHGASNNFLVWGLLNGLTMVGYLWLRRPLRWLRERMEARPLRKIAWFYACCFATYCTIASINIFFRCPDWPTAKRYVAAIFTPSAAALESWWNLVYYYDGISLAMGFGLLWTVVVFLAHEAERYGKVQERLVARPVAWAAACAGLLLMVLTFGISGPQFIYYQF